jgi:hypothetical protein
MYDNKLPAFFSRFEVPIYRFEIVVEPRGISFTNSMKLFENWILFHRLIPPSILSAAANYQALLHPHCNQLDHHGAAVDVDRLAGDIRRGVAGEK